MVLLPLPFIPDPPPPFCSVMAVKRVIPRVVLLSLPFISDCPHVFLKKLSAILSAIGFLAKDHACHSFRRGGASFAFCSGVSVKLIKMLGDWHSDAVLLYLTVPLFIRLQSVNSIKSTLTTNISTPQPTQFGSGVLLVLLAVSF